MVHTHDLPLLGGLAIFREFTSVELMLVLMSATTRTFKTEQRIIREGSVGDALHIIRQGKARVTKFDGKGVERQLAELGPGECFGEVSLIDSEPRSANVYAQTDCTVYRIARNDFADLLTIHKEIERKFYKNISRILADRLRRSNEYLTFNLEVGDMIRDIEKKEPDPCDK